jgi:hypothetical protein
MFCMLGFSTGPEFQQSAITPPSSVSPRDASGGGLTAEAMAAALRTQQYLSQAQVYQSPVLYLT